MRQHDQNTSALVTEEFMIPGGDPGVQLYVRNKHPRDVTQFSGDKVVLFLHGSLFAADTSFDLPLGGLSWMDYIAQHGYDAYLVDVRGYGKSSHPPEMSQPAANNPPVVRTDTAVKDVGAAIDFIRKRRGTQKINLIGWSWGTTILGWYTAQNNDKVAKLVLYAPQWLRTTSNVTAGGGPLGAYAVVSRDQWRASRIAGVPEDKKADLMPPGWLEAVADANFAVDSVSGEKALRAPNGVNLDNREYWWAGKPLYDPSEIRVPTFLVHAEWDQVLPSYMLYAYFTKLTHTPYKSYVEIGEGTHVVMLEKNRMQLFRAVQQFLDEQHRVGE